MRTNVAGLLLLLGFATPALCGPLKQPTSPLQITADGHSGEHSFIALKNTSQKAITQYQLACFKTTDREYVVDWTFEAANGVIATGESTQYSVSNKSPMGVCRDRNTHLGIENVVFKDGTKWSWKQ
jgi:hypothetical protein